MGTRSDPSSHTWTAEAVGIIITTNSKMLKCTAKGDFNTLIPEDLLCYFSCYYAAMLKGNFSEAGQDSIKLELTESQAKWFVTWLYSGQLPEDLDYPILFQLYIFADKTENTALRRGVMSHIHKRSHLRGNPPIEDAIKAFDVLPKSSGLVRWIVDRFANHGGYSSLQETSEFYNHIRGAHDSIVEFSCRLTNCVVHADPCCIITGTLGCEGCCHHRKDKVKRGQACAYHEHESPEEWKICAGDDFEQNVDMAYLKGTTATACVAEERFARFDRSDRMVWTLSSGP